MAYPTDDKENRIRSVMNNVVGTEDPDDVMLELLSVLEEGGKVPESGRYYVFVYNPKTPNIKYDQNPLVAVSDVFTWGFRGINLHWGKVRQYTWSEIVGQIYEIYTDELADAKEIPLQNSV